MGGAKFCDTCEKQGKAVELDDGKKVIDAYRTVNFKIPQLWRGLENAAINAVKNEGVEHHYQGGPDAPRITYLRKGNFLLCKLPSGRVLYYPYPRIELVASAYGPRETLAYWTVNAVTKKWNKETTWGGRLTENVVQGLCRDLMLEALLRFQSNGYRVIGTVHDEGVLEVPDGIIANGGLDRIKTLMTEVPKWAKGFPIGADVGHGKRYGK
jgi:DNA polymerase bacteriophage-type